MLVAVSVLFFLKKNIYYQRKIFLIRCIVRHTTRKNDKIVVQIKREAGTSYKYVSIKLIGKTKIENNFQI
jgi:hypothetical protein